MPFTRGGVRVKRERAARPLAQVDTPRIGMSSTACASLPAAALVAVALGWPNRGRDSLYSTPLRPGSLLQRAQPPDQLYAGHRPGCARYSTQHGGSDHRRPSNVETGTPAPLPISPPNTTRNNKVESKAVFRGLLGR